MLPAIPEGDQKPKNSGDKSLKEIIRDFSPGQIMSIATSVQNEIIGVVGGASAYFAEPSIPDFEWQCAAVLFTVAAIDMGTRLGRKAGIVLAFATGAMSMGGGLSAAYIRYVPKHEWKRPSDILAVLALGAGAVAFVSPLALSAVGGFLSYRVTKEDIHDWALHHALKEHSAIERVAPVRTAQQPTVQSNGKTYQVIANG